MPTIKQSQLNLTEEFAVMKNEISHIKTDITEIKNMLKEHVEWENKKYAELKNDFAGKWVEKISIGFIIFILGSVIVITLKGGI